MPEVRGAAFPFRIDPRTGGVAWSAGDVKIREDLKALLLTRLGERPMLRDFGTRVHGLVHEPDDDVTADLLRKQAHEAVVRWDRRIVVTRARVSRADGQLHLELDYVRAEDSVGGRITVPLS
ncbi:GPW/gp25 family protein [Streptomyces sp. NBC_01445]|uniref:GPW/gp25 family protein n=1 Tax=Streptomyces sp. NBC_01445 TaxID=2903869 RepID=UPI002DDAD4A3|nr:GPW/gp25 family protein [Streptomyces sp. NBC_01445]WSE03775.1 GPW/gp25 family protein [Streptomyces sp. NBC_01445]